MKKPETYILKQNRFHRHLVDIITDEKKAVIYKAPNSVTDFDELAKTVSVNFLHEFLAKEDEQVCRKMFEIKGRKWF